MAVREGGVYVDGTAGAGGHARAIAERMGPAGRLLAIDRDRHALERTRQRLGSLAGRCTLRHGNFVDLAALARDAGFDAADGVVLDLGVSSEQLEAPERGFSFMNDGPLDMRMDPDEPVPTAADLLNNLPESEVADLLRRLGEERDARRIARAVARARERHRIERTVELADLITAAKGGRRGRTHPATRTFLALRMAVNRELLALERGLEGGLSLLKPGGRMAVIAFHSLEDRIVKQCFARHAGRRESQPGGGERWVASEPPMRLVVPKPLTPSAAERARNPRARSARLRVAERKG
jgi:16S rRNA (cytosine1402-N4)-methyltransferase